MPALTYQEARSQIATGDLIAVRSPHGIIGWLTQFFTRSPYTHTGIAIWIEGGLYMGELNGGRNHIIPLSQLDGCDFDVYHPPSGLNNIAAALFFWLRLPIDYAYVAFVAIGLLNWLRAKIFVHWRQMLVCSGWCVAVYEEAGWGEHSRIVSPGELADMLKLKFEVRN